ncbi:unnamed protein product [Nesidiocoris tenuis]|uniref:Uncharacterized protein n=1 Tax=Nesidiocoris tenuis TaxID=355587 RepID=A0A6H5GUG1_9HEMI|nr:unnamed protein product [Nesidiocoris tenuis]
MDDAITHQRALNAHKNIFCASFSQYFRSVTVMNDSGGRELSPKSVQTWVDEDPQNSFSTRWNPHKHFCPSNIFNLKNLVILHKSAKQKLDHWSDFLTEPARKHCIYHHDCIGPEHEASSKRRSRTAPGLIAKKTARRLAMTIPILPFTRAALTSAPLAVLRESLIIPTFTCYTEARGIEIVNHFACIKQHHEIMKFHIMERTADGRKIFIADSCSGTSETIGHLWSSLPLVSGSISRILARRIRRRKRTVGEKVTKKQTTSNDNSTCGNFRTANAMHGVFHSSFTKIKLRGATGTTAKIEIIGSVQIISCKVSHWALLFARIPSTLQG